jgi:hypothetical protein
MIRIVPFLAVALSLSACVSVENESIGTIELNGQAYELRTRTMSGPQGSFVTHAIKANDGSYRSCDPDTPSTCRSALQTRRDSND